LFALYIIISIIKIKTMSLSRIISLSIIATLMCHCADAQNVLLNILTKDRGIVKKGRTLFLEVSIHNTDPANHVGIYKIRTQLSVPPAIASIASMGHVLPTGWTITGNTGNTITLSNGKDMIAANDARTILIAIKGTQLGGPSTITGQLSFSDGTAPGTTTGTMNGDLPADNFSTTTCTVIK
jgi:hypothetical protein